MEKKVNAWVFLASGKQDFILDAHDSCTIYFKKPKPCRNPFDYFAEQALWKPTKITITYKK